jgi:hypothetical protein
VLNKDLPYRISVSKFLRKNTPARENVVLEFHKNMANSLVTDIRSQSHRATGWQMSLKATQCACTTRTHSSQCQYAVLTAVLAHFRATGRITATQRRCCSQWQTAKTIRCVWQTGREFDKNCRCFFPTPCYWARIPSRLLCLLQNIPFAGHHKPCISTCLR